MQKISQKYLEFFKNTTAADKAKSLFCEGYNCSQSVFLTFAEMMGMDKRTALMISSSFGGGMGRMREVCGAVSGMFMAAGLIYGYDSPVDNTSKAEHYKLIQELAEKFKQKNDMHTIICRELLRLDDKKETHIPEARTPAYYKKRPCADLVYDAAQILSEYILSEK